MTVKKVSGDLVPAKAPQKAAELTFIQHVIKGETYLVLATTAREPEDEFTGLYFTQADSSKVVLKPPFEPKVLIHLTEQNNILYQCVEAMEINIDGTGHEFVPISEGKDGVEMDESELGLARSFFDEPYPGVSFVTQRRAVRRDMESTGYGFLEVLRTADGKLFGTRHLDAHQLRLVKLDDPVMVKKKIERAGKEIEITIPERERRYATAIHVGAGAAQYQYYRAYGSSRQLHRETGAWETKEAPIPPDKRATEILMFGINPSTEGPYFLPRWVNQLPSVVGSRKAEEQNLEFFDAGGMPPAIIFIQGGTLGKGMADQLRMYLSGQNKSKNRAVVVEALSATGSIESAGGVQVKVERFGAEKANDAMFSKYDQAAEEHVRVGFRLPPIFIGKTVDYNYATAKTAYMVAEAQVFAPERQEFDQVINRTLVKELGLKTLKFRSLPINLKDFDLVMKALELAKDTVEGQGLIEELNQTAGISLTYQEPVDPIDTQRKQKELDKEFSDDPIENLRRTREVEDESYERQAQIDAQYRKDARKLAVKYLHAEELVPEPAPLTDAKKEAIRKSVDALEGVERGMFLEEVSFLLTGDRTTLAFCEH